MTTGSSLDFMRNITTLRENSISINYIYQGCKSIQGTTSEERHQVLDRQHCRHSEGGGKT